MNGGQLAIETLKQAGVKFLSGYTGGAIMPFFDELVKDGKLKFIMSRNEQGAAFIAQGISRGSYHHKKPQVGVCVSTSGPGAMNLVTGVADAYMDSVPMVALTGQVTTDVIGTDAFQESDVVGVMLPVTKHSSMPVKLDEVSASLQDAIMLAATGRPGPVHVDLPKNVQMETVPDQFQSKPQHFHYKVPQVSKSQVRKAVSLINQAERPVLFCGHGVKASNCGDLLRKMSELTNIPVAFTLHGLSALPVDHRNSLGMMGMHGTVEANRTIFNCDLIVAFGMRFDDRVTGKLSAYAPQARVIHIDIDPAEISKNVKAVQGIHSDVRSFLEKLLASRELKFQPRHDWWLKIAAFRKELTPLQEAELKKGSGSEGKLLMKTCVRALSDISKGNIMVVTDVGLHQMITARFFNYCKTNSFYTSGGAGTMGAGLPMAIGVQLVNPQEQVWCICGDGGFQMNIQELGTIMQYQLPIKIMLLNNSNLGMVRQWQTLFFNRRYAATPMQNPDYSWIAKAYGIAYDRITKVTEVAPALKKASKIPGAQLLEFVCDPGEIILPMVPNGKSFAEMILEVAA